MIIQTIWLIKIWDKKQEDKWIRKKSDDAIKENIFWAERFYDLFWAVQKYYWKNKKTCMVWWVRVDESPSRKMWLTWWKTYKYITWGTKNFNNIENYYTLYPIYDWNSQDVWKYIFDKKLNYNKLYDYQYRYWVPFSQMRCSSLIHETAIRNLVYIWDISHDFLNRIETRLPSIWSVKHNKKIFNEPLKKLPYMFNNWLEYTKYLWTNLLSWKMRETVLKKIKELESNEYFKNIQQLQDKVCKLIIKSILKNDQDLVYIRQWYQLISCYNNQNFNNEKEKQLYENYLLTKK